jgi:hypothetical protein
VANVFQPLWHRPDPSTAALSLSFQALLQCRHEVDDVILCSDRRLLGRRLCGLLHRLLLCGDEF